MEALIVIFATGLISMFIALAKKPVLVLSVAVVGILTAISSLVYQMNYPYTWLKYEGLEFSGFANLYGLVALSFGLMIILVGYAKFKEEVEHTGEYISLLLFSLSGALCMLAFTDLFMFFIGLEILSIPIYVMAGSKKKDLRSTEASLKYFFTGAFATGVLLFGVAWLYGAVGTFKLDEIAAAVQDPSTHSPLLYVGVLMILASFLFKIGAAPFHFWSPDVYEGSPNVVTSFMAAIVKLAAFAAFIKLFTLAFGSIRDFWVPILVGLSILTMFVGNLTALRQITFKRLIAYSSITHVGYALMAVIDKNTLFSPMNLWVYLLAYGFSIIALIIVSLILDDEEDLLVSYKGFARRNPFAGFVMIIALLSLAGVPPLSGFFGKYLIFSSVITEQPVLVIIALVNSGIAIYYYLKLIRISLEPVEEGAPALKVNPLHLLVLGICTLGILAGGIVTWL
ncbi:MAG: NAD(P)H-quinone oxidoreductase subunit 2 [Crocinitomicaceae bacterium]|jgi:NADH-quinone oxidoreductase subunit N|nr:NAD(P)H-quinone oxidoreductase subunit 2 [Crocinitomicaceae bacterium]